MSVRSHRQDGRLRDCRVGQEELNATIHAASVRCDVQWCSTSRIDEVRVDAGIRKKELDTPGSPPEWRLPTNRAGRKASC